MQNLNAACIGGDDRNVFLARRLKERGFSVVCYGIRHRAEEAEGLRFAESLEEALRHADIIVGGIPLLKNKRINGNENLPDLLPKIFCQNVRENQSVFAGMITGEVRAACAERGVKCCDFMKENAVTVFNTIATAEGAVYEAMRRKNTNIHGSRCLVTGYGRCGKTLADKLRGLGARVTVCNRSQEALELANALGYETSGLSGLAGIVGRYEYIFNTVPAVIFDRNVLGRVQKDSLIIDIASVPGGVDYDAAGEMGKETAACLGLPGKYAPKSSGIRLADFVAERMRAPEIPNN